MRPDRFQISKAGEFVESKGRERDHPFSDITAVLPQIVAFCNIFGFPTYDLASLGRLTRDFVMYPELRVHEVYFDGSTHDVLISTTGDVSAAGGVYQNYTYQELAGSFQSGAFAINVISQTERQQVLQMGNPGFLPFCTATNTLEGDAIPIKDFLHELYELHKFLGDFNDPDWRMVRNPATLQLALSRETVGAELNKSGMIRTGKGSETIFGPTAATRNLTCGAIIGTISHLVQKTLMNIRTDGFSDWITQRVTNSSLGQSFSSERCSHGVGVELLQPAPIEMTDAWFTTQLIGGLVGGPDQLHLMRWAIPDVDSPPPNPGNIHTGTLPHCAA